MLPCTHDCAYVGEAVAVCEVRLDGMGGFVGAVCVHGVSCVLVAVFHVAEGRLISRRMLRR